jgi:hypothetical protein
MDRFRRPRITQKAQLQTTIADYLVSLSRVSRLADPLSSVFNDC